MTFTEELYGLAGKVAVVIGGGGVLGGEMACGLARAGAKTVILDKLYENAESTAEKIGTGYSCVTAAYETDATNKDDLKSACDKIISEWGKIDILVNTPGINSSTEFFTITENEWENIISVNLKSMFLSCQVFGKQMIEQGGSGSIINISSVTSVIPLSKVFTYGISKAGVNNLTRFLAREFAPQNIRVNAIVPGFFPAEQNRKILTKERTEDIIRHTPLARFGEPSELVGAQCSGLLPNRHHRMLPVRSFVWMADLRQ